MYKQTKLYALLLTIVTIISGCTRAIRLIAESDHEFSDNGSAVKWGFDKLAGMK